MRRGFETLSVAYVVVAGLYGGAMYFASNKNVVEDIAQAPRYAYEAAQQQFPQTEQWVADAAMRFHNQFATRVIDPLPDSPMAGAGVEVMIASAPEQESSEHSKPKFNAANIKISDEYFAPIASARLTQRVESRVRENLTSDHYSSFDLFIYVSKAGSGPWAQQMFVFEKKGGAA